MSSANNFLLYNISISPGGGQPSYRMRGTTAGEYLGYNLFSDF